MIWTINDDDDYSNSSVSQSDTDNAVVKISNLVETAQRNSKQKFVEILHGLSMFINITASKSSSLDEK